MPTIAEIKTKLIPIFDAYGVQSATLFGSIAKGTATERSDLDLLVDSGLKGLTLRWAYGSCAKRGIITC